MVFYINKNEFALWTFDSKQQTINNKLNLIVTYITKQ